jgi:hypothetical protein
LSPEQESDSERSGGERSEDQLDEVDEQEDESFPASDPHSDWAGPPSEDE